MVAFIILKEGSCKKKKKKKEKIVVQFGFPLRPLVNPPCNVKQSIMEKQTSFLRPEKPLINLSLNRTKSICCRSLIIC